MASPYRRPAPAERGTANGPRLLSDLLDTAASGAGAGAGRTRVTGITANSEDVREGFLFVAVRGRHTDGHRFVGEAVEGGAAAIVAENGFHAEVGVPVVHVGNTRRALADLAAAWYGHPAKRLSMVGITGTVGKTSVLSILEAIATTAGERLGVIGSLGVRVDGKTLEQSVYTSPDALLLQESLARIAASGCGVAAMEVTSHALDQDRIGEIRYDLGIFTNLIPLEHSDYHGSFRKYVEAKRRFLDHLPAGAILVYNGDDRSVRRLVQPCDVRGLDCGTSSEAAIRIESVRTKLSGTRLVLDISRALPRLDGGEVEPMKLDLEMRLLGRANVGNAALATTAALALGMEPRQIRAALARFPPPRRRMEVVHDGAFTVIDDTVGHPESITALFEVARELAPRRVHVAFGVRGRRGVRINRQLAESLAIWHEHIPLETLVVTRSSEAADELNTVTDREYGAFRGILRDHGVGHLEEARLDDAVRAVLERARSGDLVLLLGAQGMNGAQAIAREWLEREDPLRPPP